MQAAACTVEVMREDPGAVAPALVTGAEIARLAGVTRAAVSNWRRRYDDFPAPVGGGAGAPLFALHEVHAWLAKQHKGQELSDEVRLWQALRGVYGEDMLAGLTAVARQLVRGTGPQAGAEAEAVRELGPQMGELVGRLAARDSAAEVISGLTERYLDAARRSGSEQSLSPRIARAVRHFAPPLPEGATLFDPACGIGTLLLSLGSGPRTRLRGQDLDPAAAGFAQLRAQLVGLADVSVGTGDSLRADCWPELRADLVLCDPPVAERDWGREELLLDSRWELGTPSRAEGELAWLQHCYAHTAPGGQVLMVLPASVAYRKAGRRIRAEMVRRGVITQLVALPAGSAASHKQPVHLWLLRRPLSPADAAPAVRLVDLTGNDPDADPEPREEQTVEVPLVELLDDTVDLTPSRHVRASHRDHAAEYAAVRREIESELTAMAPLLPALAEAADAETFDAATVSLGELGRAGLVEFTERGPVSASEQLDEDYLRGFLRSAANTRRSTSASGTFRLDARGARVPQMAIGEQRRYGAAFRAVEEFEKRLAKIARLGERAAALARDGLTGGSLAPPDDV